MSRFRSAPVWLPGIGLLLLVAGPPTGAGGRPQAGEGSESARRHVIEIQAFEYRPASLEVAPGDTVVWVNRDLVPHTVTAGRGDWDSGKIEPGDAWRQVVRSDRGLRYTCTYHPNMEGTLELETAHETKGAAR